MNSKQLLKVTCSDCDRLDKYLSLKLNDTRSKIKRYIDSGYIQVNGKLKNCHYKVACGDEITIEVPEIKNNNIKAQDINLEIIHEDKHYIIVNKPPGLVVHPAPGNRNGTLLNGLMEKHENPQLVHRLDKDTSGLLIVALDDDTALNIRNQFKMREVKKVYHAIVDGNMKEESGEISAPIKRSRRDPTKMDVGWSNARGSTTRFKVLKQLDEATLVEIYLLTGRTHQIRVHFSYYGYPVSGDAKYGDLKVKASRQMLHAKQISFTDPDSKKRVYYESQYPGDFSKLLEKLDRL